MMEVNVRERMFYIYICIYIYTYIHIHTYDWIVLLYSRNWYNMVNEL